MNYTGDRLNFGAAAERAKAEGLKVEMVVTAGGRLQQPWVVRAGGGAKAESMWTAAHNKPWQEPAWTTGRSSPGPPLPLAMCAFSRASW